MKIDIDDSGWSQYVMIDIETDETEQTLEIVRNKLEVKKQKKELHEMNQNDKHKQVSSTGVITIYAISVFCLLSMYVGFLLYN